MKKKSSSVPSSKADLAKALLAQSLCCHKKQIARWLAANGARAESVKSGKRIIKEGDRANRDVFCIVSGSFKIDIGGHEVNVRGKRYHVGEMAMITKEARTASVIAIQDSRVIRIPEKVMRKAYKIFPEMWEPVASTLCERLHERRKFFRVKNKYPKIFIGSSGARKFVAEALKKELDQVIRGEVRVWTDDDIFQPSTTTLQAIIDQSRACDFGIFIFGADDKVTSKGGRYRAPRDNVVFEGGIFTGSCGICRTFYVCENYRRLKMPSDLDGVTFLNFSLTKGTKLPKFGASVTRLANIIKKLRTI